MKSIRTRRAIVVAALAALPLAILAAPSPALADGPNVGSPWAVSVGDSFISGEGGRWAGNASSESVTDALGSTAYYDNATNSGELIAKCHRSKAAPIKFMTNSMNFACSGAQTMTTWDGSTFKPGLDFYSSGANQGQALMLQNFAKTHNVKMVAVSVGGNNFGFAGLVTRCVEDFLIPLYHNYCNDDDLLINAVSSSNVATQRNAIAVGLQNIRTAMRNAGYSDSSWTMVVSNYPSVIPTGSGFRYSESGYTRQTTGGCGFYNSDANYANYTLIPTINRTVSEAVANSGVTNIKMLDYWTAFNGRRLCENTVGKYAEVGLTSWTQSGAVDKTEWFENIRTVTAGLGNYFIQESAHPNYWGEKAMRNCLRQAWNGGTVKGGKCVRSSNGLNGYGEPYMSLQ